MATLAQQLKKAQKLSYQKASNELFDFVRKFENELAQRNKFQLLVKSKDVNDNPIGFYSQATENITKGRKKAGQPFNLLETGTLLGSLTAKVEKTRKAVFFDFSDPKKNEVYKNLLTTDVLGLTDEALREALEKPIKDYMINYYRKSLDL